MPYLLHIDETQCFSLTFSVSWKSETNRGTVANFLQRLSDQTAENRRSETSKGGNWRSETVNRRSDSDNGLYAGGNRRNDAPATSSDWNSDVGNRRMDGGDWRTGSESAEPAESRLDQVMRVNRWAGAIYA